MSFSEGLRTNGVTSVFTGTLALGSPRYGSIGCGNSAISEGAYMYGAASRVVGPTKTTPGPSTPDAISSIKHEIPVYCLASAIANSVLEFSGEKVLRVERVLGIFENYSENCLFSCHDDLRKCKQVLKIKILVLLRNVC